MKKDSYKMGKTEPFFPDFLFKEAIAALLFFIVLLLIVVFSHVPLESLADPTDATYIPRPEWYFMFLFQMLKYFPGELEPVAVFVLPTIGIIVLLLLPFLDRRRERRPSRRPVASAAAFFGLAGMLYLTTMAIATTPPPAPASTAKLSAAATAGKKQFQDLGCGACHQPGGGSAPDLSKIVAERDEEFIRKYVKNPKALNPNSIMPSFDSLTDEQMNHLLEYLQTLKQQ